jgi:glycogenin
MAGRLDLTNVLTKLHVFRLTSYRKVIFMDADILPLQPISHLFHLKSAFAAVPDVGWPDIFNSGFFVMEPSEEKFNEVTELAKTKGSWDGGDQGVLNEWVGPNWERLSFTYNTTPTAVYT